MESKFKATRKPASEKRNYANTKSTLQKTARKAVADENKAIREGRTAKDQVAHLDRVLGKGQGAKKERERLAAFAARGK